jgi:hypothetical protein
MTKHVKPSAPPIDAEQMAPYVECGWQAIPLHRPTDVSDWHGKKRKDGKRPLDKEWTTKSYDSAKVIAQAVRDGRNVGIRLTAAQLVIDVDPRNGGDAGFAALCRDLGLDADEWPRVITGSGGSHFYMTKDERAEIGVALDQYPGVEFKTEGSQVVAAGSVHPETLMQYEWDVLNPSLPQAKPAPASLMELVAKKPSAAAGGGEHTPAEIAVMLAVLDASQFRDHGMWLELMMACHHASGGLAKEEFLDWSASDPDYTDARGVNGGRWESLNAGGEGSKVTYRTLYKIITDAGHADAIPRPSAAEDFADADEAADAEDPVASVASRGLTVNRNSVAADSAANALRAVAASGLKPAWDELAQKVVFRDDPLPWPEKFGRALDDNVLRIIRLSLMERYQGNDFQPSRENLFEAVTTVALGNSFNPVIEYLAGLTWDGVPRVERLFGDYMNCGSGEYERAVSRCFMVGAVRRMRSPGSKFDTMPILRSPQGWNKSTALKALFGADWLTDAELGDLNGKDAAIQIRGVWAVEFPEIDSLRRAEVGTLRAFCSRPVDRIRDPYERVSKDVPRRCVFVGTVNEGGFLKDQTGNRRFWPLTVSERIDVAKIVAHRDQLWAEASAMEAGGERDVLPEWLWPIAAQRQAAEESADPWADVLDDFLASRAWEHAMHDPASMEDGDVAPPPGNKVHTAELYVALGLEVSKMPGTVSQRLRTVMEQRLGWHYRESLRIGSRVRAGYERNL